MKFYKYHGIGNDFVLIDGQDIAADQDMTDLARRMSDRRFGVGSDGLLIVEPSSEADVFMRMYNPDGSEAEMCGNGIRCFAKHVYDFGIVPKPEMTIATVSGVKSARLRLAGDVVESVTIGMGSPSFKRDDLPMAGEGDPFGVELDVNGRNYVANCLSVGNPHAVMFVPDVSVVPLELDGPAVEHHALFPKRINAQFNQVVSRDHLKLRVWERGAGVTLACGTGACASGVAAIRLGLCDSPVRVSLPGGDLTVEWMEGSEILMTGPAVRVFEGEWG